MAFRIAKPKSGASVAFRQAAAASLAAAEALLERLDLPPPFHVGAYRTSRLLLDLEELEDACARGDRAAAARWRRRAGRDARALLAVARKMARLRTEAYRLVGRLAWLRGRRRAAQRWWTRSIREGERLGARPELARTCAEVARRLDGAASARVDGRSPAELHELAGELFRELGLAPAGEASRAAAPIERIANA